jgi:hypothetical protein
MTRNDYILILVLVVALFLNPAVLATAACFGYWWTAPGAKLRRRSSLLFLWSPIVAVAVGSVAPPPLGALALYGMGLGGIGLFITSRLAHEVPHPDDWRRRRFWSSFGTLSAVTAIYAGEIILRGVPANFKFGLGASFVLFTLYAVVLLIIGRGRGEWQRDDPAATPPIRSVWSGAAIVAATSAVFWIGLTSYLLTKR